MDTTYIKMSDCPEIQEPKRDIGAVHGDYLYSKLLRKVDILCLNPAYRYGLLDTIWLPRQDDLQKMVADTIDCPSHSSCAIFINVGHRMHQWCDEAWDYWMRFTSMEQLWLAFVMKEKYNKVWNGEEWNV